MLRRDLFMWADEVNIDLRAYGVAHPVFGLMNGMQWVLFAAAHTERHRAAAELVRTRVGKPDGAPAEATGYLGRNLNEDHTQL